MSENIFEESTQSKLSSVFKSMVTPKTQTQEVIKESKETQPVKKVEIVEEEENIEPTSKVGSKFDSAFKSIFSEKVGCDDCDDDCDCKDKKKKVFKEESEDYVELEGGDEGYEDEYTEDKMVSVPQALLDELYSYVEDTMGSEDESNVDDVDFELPEEGADVKLVKSRMADTTVQGSVKQKNTVGTSVAKTGDCCADKNSRDGKVEKLKQILGGYTTNGSVKQPNKGKVGSHIFGK